MTETSFELAGLLAGDMSLRWIITMLHFLWQGAMIGSLAVIAAGLLRGSSASIRYWLYSGSLICLPLCVVVTFLNVDVPASWQTDRSATVAVVIESVESTIPPTNAPLPGNDGSANKVLTAGEFHFTENVTKPADITATAEPALPAPTAVPVLSRIAPWVSVAYLACVFCLLLRLGAGLWGGHRLRSTATRITGLTILDSLARQATRVGLRFVPVVAYCDQVAVPTVVGILRPVVLLPASVITGLNAQDLTAIISHELAHIRRHDLWMNLLQRVIESLLFIHPVVWFISRRMSAEREVCCDDLVISAGHQRLDYAGALLRMAELCALQRQPNRTALAADGDNSSLLERRIQRLMNDSRTPRLQLTRAGVLALMMTLAALIAIPSFVRNRALGVEPPATNVPSVDENADQLDPGTDPPQDAVIEEGVIDGGTGTPLPDESPKDVAVRYPYCVVNVDGLKERPLAEAIKTFNREARESPIGQQQKPITRQETQEAIAKFVEQAFVPDSVKKVLRAVVSSGTLPANVYFRRFTRFDDEQQMHGVWWVRLVVESSDPPVYSVPIRSQLIFSRPYTQMERQQNATGGVTLINRFSSYFEDLPNILLLAAFPPDAIDRLVSTAETAIKAKDFDAFQSLFEWKGTSESTRTFVQSEFETLTRATIHSIRITPRNFRGNLIHWSAYQHYKPNLPVVGYLNIEFTPADDKSGLRKTLSLEMGRSGDAFPLVNYVTKGKRRLPKGSIDGLSMRGHVEPLADGTYLVTDLITHPGTLLSAHLANEEIRQRDYEHKKKAIGVEVVPPVGAGFNAKPLWGAEKRGIQLGISHVGERTAFRTGEPVPWNLHIRNNSDRTVEVTLNGGFRENVPTVRNTDGHEIQFFQKIVGFEQLPLSRTLAPGKGFVIRHPVIFLGDPKVRDTPQGWSLYWTDPEPGTYSLEFGLQIDVKSSPQDASSRGGDFTVGPIEFEVTEEQQSAANEGGGRAGNGKDESIRSPQNQPSVPPLKTADKTQATKPPVPPNARVTLSCDRDEYFLGENVLVHFKLENTGGEPFEANFGGDYRGAARALRFKVKVLDEKSQTLADPYPSELCFGGMGGTREITPDKPFYSSLPIVRYARFDRPGTYEITTHHDFGWDAPPMNVYPEGRITLRFKQPTDVDAARLVNEWLAAGKYGGSTWGEKAEPHADFSQLRFATYLAPLIEPAKQGSKLAIIGIGSIKTPEATRVLIDLVKASRIASAGIAETESVPKQTPAADALSQLCSRLRDPYLRGELGKRNPFEDGAEEPRRWLVENSWRPEFTNDIRQLALEMLTDSDQHLVATGAYMLECAGTQEDAPHVIAALDREVEKTRGMKLQTNLYPRPRGACMELQRAATMMLKRGVIAPAAPKSPGECVLFVMELKRNDEFRPDGWLETCDQLLQHKIPYIQEQTLKHLPTPLPESLRPRLAAILKSRDVDASIEACHIVEKEKLAEFRDVILKILTNAKEDWHYAAADNAALALDTNYERIEILVSRLDQPEMLFKCLNSLKSIFSNVGGGGWSSNIDVRSEARRVKPLWAKFIQEHSADLKAGTKYELPHPAISGEMFPEQFSMTLRPGGEWPERN